MLAISSPDSTTHAVAGCLNEIVITPVPTGSFAAVGNALPADSRGAGGVSGFTQTPFLRELLPTPIGPRTFPRSNPNPSEAKP